MDTLALSLGRAKQSLAVTLHRIRQALLECLTRAESEGVSEWVRFPRDFDLDRLLDGLVWNQLSHGETRPTRTDFDFRRSR